VCTLSTLHSLGFTRAPSCLAAYQRPSHVSSSHCGSSELLKYSRLLVSRLSMPFRKKCVGVNQASEITLGLSYLKIFLIERLVASI